MCNSGVMGLVKPQPKNKAIRLSTRKLKLVKDEVWSRDRGICQICHEYCVVPEYHHVIFRSQGGGDTLDNLLTLCWKHHTAGIHGGGKDAQELRELAERIMWCINRGEELNEKGM
jgi:5-methylcytosine-specific restriction endonuclease McrA